VAKTAQPKVIENEQVRPTLGGHPWEQVPPEIAAVMRPDIAGTRDAIIDGIRAEVPAYARPLEGAFGAGVRVGVEQALNEFVALVENPAYDRSQGHEVYVALGRGEAREGRSLEALLSAYRIGARIAWRRIAARTQQGGIDTESLALLAESIFAYIDELSSYSAEGHAQEQALAAAESDRLRHRLVQLLIDPRPADPAAIEAAAREAGWELPATLAALVWRETRRSVASRLPEGAIVSPIGELSCALVPDPEGPGRARALEAALRRRTATLGPAVEWTQAALSAQQALAAHRLLEEGRIGGEGVIASDRYLPELILHRDSALTGALRRRALAPLDGETQRSRERLGETLLAWLDHQASVPATAAALHVHPQTVRYRLNRLRELFGERLDDPAGRFELALALRAAQH
jgi:hypothetical protein